MFVDSVIISRYSNGRKTFAGLDMNVSRSSVFFIFVLFGYFVCVSGNAALIRPTARGMMWIKGNHSPTNYNYMGLNCGGLKVRQ